MADLWFPFEPRPAWSPVVLDRNGRLLAAYLAPDDSWRVQGKLEEFDPRFIEALIFKEDRWFYWHVGINPVAIVRAAGQNLVQGKRVSGASTITMQVARLLDPGPRTYSRKLQEAFRALQLEFHFSKNEILSLYINLLPYGGNISGLKTAALLYLDAAPDALSLGQLTALAVVPNRPGSLRLGRFPARLLEARNRWLGALQTSGVFPPDQLQRAQAEPVVFRRRALLVQAPHLCRYLVSRYPTYDGEPRRTCLDAHLQQRASDRLRQHVRSWRLRGVEQAAAVVIHNATGEVRAWVGSAGFSEAAYLGEVDGVRARRSPGSALKPLLYALAFEQGRLLPTTRVADVPIDLKGYAPENYDQTFRGWLPASDALGLSLNIPAVRLLQQVGVDTLARLLRQGGLRLPDPSAGRLGLSMILGGCEVSLLELTNLYATLARNGVYLPSRFELQAPPTGEPDHLLGPGACWLTTDILARVRRPDLPADWQATSRLPRIAWKTGTSYGRRDAWAVGYTTDYTVGVWVGNFRGQGNAALSGAEAATPLLFDLFGLLPASNRWFARPSELEPRQVCARTGLLAGEHCTETLMALGLKHRWPPERCTHRQAVWVSTDGQESYCPRCLPPAGFREAIYDRWPPELVEYFDAQRIPYDRPPRHYAGCPQVAQDRELEITSPTPEAELLVEHGKPARLTLAARTGSRGTRLHWFVNGKYLRAVPTNEPLVYEVDSGLYWIVCRDDEGRSQRARVRVVRY
mgnify:CR=1 FL=1